MGSEGSGQSESVREASLWLQGGEQGMTDMFSTLQHEAFRTCVSRFRSPCMSVSKGTTLASSSWESGARSISRQ